MTSDSLVRYPVINALVSVLISELLQKSPEDLAMNQADNYRAVQEDRYIVDRTIPAEDYGKGCKLTRNYSTFHYTGISVFQQPTGLDR